MFGCGTSGPSETTGTSAPPWFRDVTDQVGLDFTHDAGTAGSYFMPQSMGSGAALFDFDNDGRLDIYLLQCAGPRSKSTNRLYKQTPDGRFQDVSKGSGLDIAGYNTGVAVGDVNNDGRPDVLVTQYGGLKLFLNNGDGTFTDVSAEAGLDSLAWGTSASFVDFDRDGWLDLVVVNYVAYDPSHLCHGPHGERDFCHPREFPGSVTRLYRNLGRGKGIRFEDVTDKAGLGKTPGPGLGVLCADFDGDGWPDIFIANDGEPNRLWINQKDGTFRDEAVRRGVAYNAMGQAHAGMGVAWGDVDGDGLADVFVTHLSEETHTLWLQGPRGEFRDRTVPAGLAAPAAHGTGFGTVLADFDHDGSLDLAVVHGRVYRGQAPPGAAALGPFWSAYGERNALLANDGRGHFRDLSASNPDFCATPNVGRGLVYGDVDGDGALDLLATTVGGRARLYRNVTPHRGHWLLVRAIDPALGRDAYGADVTVRDGDRLWRRLVNPASGYQCSNDPRAHFGLGSAAHVDAIEVTWPDGFRETFAGRDADQVAVLRKGEGAK
jgi:hypothetical protein